MLRRGEPASVLLTGLWSGPRHGVGHPAQRPRRALPIPKASPPRTFRLFVGVGGIPSLHFGPGDVRYAHAPGEQVDLDEVIAVARALVVLAVRECSAHR